ARSNATARSQGGHTGRNSSMCGRLGLRRFVPTRQNLPLSSLPHLVRQTARGGPRWAEPSSVAEMALQLRRLPTCACFCRHQNVASVPTEGNHCCHCHRRQGKPTGHTALAQRPISEKAPTGGYRCCKTPQVT